ncbi:MAG: phosphate acyltransferase [Bacilli bacterium]|nr:phosphate acyltransferase [Bacilli bacterium]
MTDILKNLTKSSKIVAVVCPEEKEVMGAVFEAVKIDLCKFLLFGNEEKINSFIIDEKLCKDKITIIPAVDSFESVRLALETIASGKADVLMKGLIDTGFLMREFFKTQYGLRTNRLLSHIMVLESKRFNRPLFLSDGGLNINPTAEELFQIVVNAVDFAISLGIKKPKVALLSATEKINPKVESSIKSQAVSELFIKEQRNDCEVFGPLSLDLALSKEAAIIKGISNSVVGKADILIAPFLEVANVIYKTWVLTDNDLRTAGIVVGGKAPIILTSRSDSQETKFNSIVLGIGSNYA